MRELNETKALILLSGGQDSATCLAWALNKFKEIYTISFYYGQKHVIELSFSEKLSKLANAKEHITINLADLFKQVTESELMKPNGNISTKNKFDESLPSSFVPFRNMQFLTQAASIAYTKQIKNLITGTCQTDYCIPASELVITNKGKIRMDDLQIGDLVLSSTLDGKLEFKKVLNKWNRGIRNDILKINCEGGRIGKMTSNHKTFRVLRSNPTSKGYDKQIEEIECKDIKIDDFMLAPRPKNQLLQFEKSENKKIDLLKYCDKNHPQLYYNNDFIWFKSNNKVNRFVDEDDIIRLIAWFITEGSIGSGISKHANNYRVGIPQSYNTYPEFFEEIYECIERWGFKICEPKLEGTNLYFSGPTTNIFRLCGTLSHNKKIPMDFIFNNIPLLFETLIKGDGNIYDNGSNFITQYSTKSWVLKEQICWLAQMLGYYISVHYHPIRQIYSITLTIDQYKNMNCIEELKMIKVKKIEDNCEPEEVYDIEVEDNHTFFIGEGAGILVSNSGYPDCRDSFIKSLNQTLNLASGTEFIIHTPLMFLSKSESVLLMKELNHLDWYEFTNTCYNGNNCGECPACKLRIKGFKEAGINDLITYK